MTRVTTCTWRHLTEGNFKFKIRKYLKTTRKVGKILTHLKFTSSDRKDIQDIKDKWLFRFTLSHCSFQTKP